MTALVRSGTYVVEAHANWSAWAAKCGRCIWGGRLQRWQTAFDCPFCGAVNEVLWPTPGMVQGVERLLLMRPDPSTRNWWPHETLHDLMFENAAHGVFDNAPEMEPGVVKLSVNDFGIQTDNLPVLESQTRKALG